MKAQELLNERSQQGEHAFAELRVWQVPTPTPGGTDMNAVTIGVASRDETNARFLRAMAGEPQGAWRTFASVADLWRTLTPKRWGLLLALAGAGPVSVREAARRVGRDVKAVHTDVQILLNAGLLEKTPAGAIEFPFDAVHVDFMLRAAS